MVSRAVGVKILSNVAKKTKKRTERKLQKKFNAEKKELTELYEFRLARMNEYTEKLIQKFEWRLKIKDLRNKKTIGEMERAHKKELKLVGKAGKIYLGLNQNFELKRNEYSRRIDQKSEDINNAIDIITSQTKKLLGQMNYLNTQLEKDKKKNDVKIKEKIYKANDIMQNVFNLREKRIVKC
jgi:hypothetical protein